jgi:hypothetical protein
MTMHMPSELADALSLLGFDWPDADEDKLNDMGKAWSTFAGELRNLVGEADRHAQAVWTGNAGAAVAAFQKSWTGPMAPVTNLRDAADAAAYIAVGLSTAAKVVIALKVEFLVEVGAFARTCYLAALAAKTPWTAAAAIAAVIAHKIIVTQALNAAIQLAIEALLNG